MRQDFGLLVVCFVSANVVEVALRFFVTPAASFESPQKGFSLFSSAAVQIFWREGEKNWGDSTYGVVLGTTIASDHRAC